MALKLGSLFFDIFARTKGLDKAEKQVKKSTGRMTKSFARLGTAIIAALSFEAARRAQLLADQMILLDVRIEAVSDTTQEFARNQRELLKIANETGQAFGDVVVLFEKIKLATEELGASNDEILELTDSLNKLGVIGGASADAINNSLRQLSQAFSGGIFRAEEFNSIVENTPAIARAIAAGMELSVGQLRQMVIEGRLMATDVMEAIKNQQDEIDKRFEKIPRTSAMAWQAVENQAAQALKLISQEIDSTKGISGALDRMAEAVLPITFNFLRGAQLAQSEWQKAALQATVAWDTFAAIWETRSVSFEITAINAQLAWLNAVDKMEDRTSSFFKGLVQEAEKPQSDRSILSVDFWELLSRAKAKFTAGPAISEAAKIATVSAEIELSTREKLEARLIELVTSSEGEKLKTRLESIEAEKNARLTAIQAELDADLISLRRRQAGIPEGGESEEIELIDVTASRLAKQAEFRAAAFQEQLAKLGDETAQILEAHKKRVDGINKIIELSEKQKRELIKKSEQILQRDQTILTRMRVASVQGAVDSVIGIIGEGNARQSALGRAALGVSKGLAIAEAAIALQQNIAQASKVGFPANIPLIAAAIGQGASIISTLQGISINPGRVNGGPAVGGFATPITESGAPEIFENARGKFLLPGAGQGGQVTPLGAAGGGQIKVTINNFADPVDVTANMVSRDEFEITLERQSEAIINQVNTSLASGQGSTSDSLRQGFDTQRNIR